METSEFEVSFFGLIDHIEISHERELSDFYSMPQLRIMHATMHLQDHWDHTHKEGRSV